MSESGKTLPDAWLRSAVPVRPGGGSDDAPMMAAAYARGVATGRAVVLEKGVYQWASPQELPVGAAPLVVWGCPGVVIQSTLPADGLELNAPFNYNPAPPPAAVTTLSALAVKGSAVLHVVDASDASLAPGNFLRVEVDPPTVLRMATYLVVARNIGAKTITVDRPVRRTFAAGTLVTPWVPLRDFKLYGNGLLIEGTGDRGFEVVGGWNCFASDFRVEGFHDFVCGYDLGSTKCVFDRVTVRAGATAFACMAFENSELCELRTAWLQGGTQTGLLLPGAVDFRASGVRQWGAQTGCTLTVNDASNTEGGDAIDFEACSWNGNIGDGFVVRDGTTNVRCFGMSASYNGGDGVHVMAPVGSNLVPPDRVVFVGLEHVGNVGAGFHVDSASEVEIANISTLDNAGGEVFAQGGARVSVVGGKMLDLTGAAFKSVVLSRDNASLLRLTRCRIESQNASNLQICETGTNADMALDDCDLVKTVGPGILMQATGGGEMSARKVSVSGATYPVLLDTGGKVHLDAETNLNAGTVANSKVDVLNAASFLIDAPGYAGVSKVPLPAGGVYYLTWADYHAGVVVFTTGAIVGATTVGVPPIRTRQRYVNQTAFAVSVVAVDGTGTPIGTGPTLAAATSADLVFDGTNVLQVS